MQRKKLCETKKSKRNDRMRDLLRLFAGKGLAIVLSLAFQAAILGYIVWSGSVLSETLGMLLTLISLLCVLFVLTRPMGNEYKLVWTFWILLFPVFGGIAYLLLNCHFAKAVFAKRARACEKRYKEDAFLCADGVRQSDLAHYLPMENGEHVAEVTYLSRHAGYAPFTRTQSTFLRSGEQFFDVLCQTVAKAEKYIFLEYFILEEGNMWNTLLALLEEKAKKGVLVRVLYDDLGCFLHLPRGYAQILRQKRIECAVFNPFLSAFTVEQNHRDHRKIAVVDGKYAITGGANLADEYINVVEKFGHWKDAAVLLQGAGAWGFTLMFLQMWSLCQKQKGVTKEEKVEAFLPPPSPFPDDGLVIPYADNPLDGEKVGASVYLQIIQKARKYVYITTPYLIIDDVMLNALTLAAKSGVDVRIVTPKKWDKRVVHLVTRSYYRELMEAGVRIYEYTLGFIHSKTMVSDDVVAAVGSTNLDYRSLYLHFECGVLLRKCSSVTDVKQDFLSTLHVAERIQTKRARQGFASRLCHALFRLLAPLL